MSEIEIQKIIDMNYRVLILLGMVTPMLIDYKNILPRSKHLNVDWFMDALNAVVYENKPIPPLPEREYI